MKAVLAYLLGLITDAKGRPEPKMILGIPILVAAVVDLLIRRELAVFGALSGLGVALVSGAAIADASIDAQPHKE